MLKKNDEINFREDFSPLLRLGGWFVSLKFKLENDEIVIKNINLHLKSTLDRI